MEGEKENKDKRAFKDTESDRWAEWSFGLTKREYFAAMAMQGILANPCNNGLERLNISTEAVKQAAFLLIELEKAKALEQ